MKHLPVGVRLIIFTAVLAVAVVALCVALHSPEINSSTLEGAAHPMILRRGNGPEPESLDPHAARSEAALTILRDLDEGLTAIGPDDRPVMAAAEHVDISADGLIYRFHLRKGAVWSNGESVVAEDFAAAWRRLVDPRTGAEYADILSAVRGASGITRGTASPASLGVHAEDAATLVVELNQRTPYFLAVLAHPATFPINRGSLARLGRGFAKPGVLISNGAFVVTRWDFGSHLVALRNHRYWNDGATRLDAVEYYTYADAASELRAFRTGQVDVTAGVPAAQTEWIRQHLGGALYVTPQLAVYYLGLNLTRPPFAHSRELRQALSLVIDRDRLVQSITGGGEIPAYSFVPPQTAAYTPPLPDYAAWSMRKRLARGRELLHEAGMDQHPPTLELRYNSGELHNRIAIAVAQMWKQALGIDTTLRAEEFKVLLQDVQRGDVSVFRGSWIADYDDAYSFLQVLRSGFGINTPHYSSAVYDQLLENAVQESDGERRSRLLERAEQTMLTDQPLIPLFFYVSKHLVSAHVHGWQNTAMNVVYSKSLWKDDLQGHK